MLPADNPYILHMIDGPPYVIDVTDEDDDGFVHEFALVPGPDGTLVEHNIMYSAATPASLPPYVPPPRRPMTPRPGTPTLAPAHRPPPPRPSCAGWFSAPRGTAHTCAAQPGCAATTMVRCDRCYRSACRDHCTLAPTDTWLRQFVCAACARHPE